MPAAPTWRACWSTAPPRSARRCASAPPSTTLDPGRRRRRRHVLRRLHRALRPGRRRRRRPLPGPVADRHRGGHRPGRHGHLAGLHAAAGRRRPAPTSTTAAPATSPATARPARTRIYAYLVEDAQDRTGLLRRRAARDHARARRALPRPVGRDPRADDRPVAGQLHLVRAPRGRRPVEPRAASCSSATPRTPARPPSPRAAPRPSRTPSCSAEVLLAADDLDATRSDTFTDRRLAAGRGGRRELRAARPVAARPRAPAGRRRHRRRPRPHGPHLRAALAAPVTTRGDPMSTASAPTA